MTPQDKKDLDLFFKLVRNKPTPDPLHRHWVCQRCPDGPIYDWNTKVCPKCGRYKTD